MNGKNQIRMLCNKTGRQMMSFIITTGDGKLIVIDGGWVYDAPKLLGVLQKIGGEKPTVDAWLFTHPHSDHIGAFNELMRTSPDAVTVKALYYNFPSLTFLHQDPDEVEEFAPDTFAEVYGKAHCPSNILWAGDAFDVGEAHFECLYSPNPDLLVNTINNASVVCKMTLAGKTFLFLGDAGVEEGERMLAKYAGTDKLRADYVQMAHHGQNGAGEELYKAVAPKGCFWCTPIWLWNNDAGQGFNTHVWKTVTVRGWMEKLGVSEHYKCFEGDVTLEL